MSGAYDVTPVPAARVAASKPRRPAGTQAVQILPILLSIEQVCVYLGGISERKIRGMASAGEMPKPLKLGKTARWRRSDLDAWSESLLI